MHGAVRNVLELLGELAEEAFFLGFGKGNPRGVAGILNCLFRRDKASFHKFIQTGVDRTHSVPTSYFHNANDLFHPSGS